MPNLNKDKVYKDKDSGRITCRFGFQKDYIGFVPIWDVTGSHLQAIQRDNNKCPEGVEIHKGELLLLRNHKRLVTHIPELLNYGRDALETSIL